MRRQEEKYEDNLEDLDDDDHEDRDEDVDDEDPSSPVPASSLPPSTRARWASILPIQRIIVARAEPI